MAQSLQDLVHVVHTEDLPESFQSLTLMKHSLIQMRWNAPNTGASATVLRMYHAVATLTASGAIWTGGTNAQGSYSDQYDPSKSM